MIGLLTLDVIHHVTIRPALCSLLQAVNWYQFYISHDFRDISLKHLVVMILTVWGHVTS